MSTYFHFPPDLFGLLVDTIPRLNKTKKDLLLFFQNIGVPKADLKKYYQMLAQNKEGFKKYEVTREILTFLNERGGDMLGVRRKLLQRVVEFDSFEMCYPNDKDRARGNVAEIQKIVKLKDTLTKYENYIDTERREKIRANEEKAEKLRKAKSDHEGLKQRFYSLFSIQNPQERGKQLENVLNDIFAYFKIGVKEAFTIRDDETGRIYEQIDGVIEVNSDLALVEMKWEKEPVGAEKIGRFMSRLMVRRNVAGIIISHSSFTDTGVTTAKEALAVSTLALIDLKDILDVVDQEKDLRDFLSKVMHNVALYKNPKPCVSIRDLKMIDF